MGSTGPYRANPRPLKVKCNGNDDLKTFFMDPGVATKLKQFFGSDTVRARRDKTLLERLTSKHLYLNYYKAYTKDLYPEEGTTPFQGKK